jgi:3-dehydrosphinganine reductase
MARHYFKNKCVLISGGSSGIGLAAAQRLRQYGAHLILLARDGEKLARAKALLEQIPSEQGQLHVLALDVSQRERAVEAMRQLPAGLAVDILINNAGITMPGHFLDLPLEQFEQQVQINYLGAVYLTHSLLPAMVAKGQGHVAFVSSLVGLMGIFGYTAYAPSKFALRGLAESLRCELKPRGIQVSICYPPDTDTPQHVFEQQYLPAATRAIAGNAKCLTAQTVADALLEGMAAQRFHIVPGGSARFADIMYRIFPGMVRKMFDSDVRKAGVA